MLAAKVYMPLLAGVLALGAATPGFATRSSAAKPPYPPSGVISGISFDWATYRRRATGSDLWPVTWGVDDKIYTSWGDGGGFAGTNSDGRVSLGFAHIQGAPESFIGTNIWGGKDSKDPATFGGKSVGIVSVSGVLYAWINTQNGIPPAYKLAWSNDRGKTWHQADWHYPDPIAPDFMPGTILNFGKDYMGARDDYVYCYGGKRGRSDRIYLARVRQDHIAKRASYEFFRGKDVKGRPLWTHDITQRVPVFSDTNLANSLNGALHASVIYNPGINRYLLTVPHGDSVAQWGMFDAPEPWGPWTTVAYYDTWGGFSSSRALLYSMTTKWISDDGQTIWVIFSGTGGFDSFNLVKGTLTLLPTTRELPDP